MKLRRSVAFSLVGLTLAALAQGAPQAVASSATAPSSSASAIRKAASSASAAPPAHDAAPSGANGDASAGDQMPPGHPGVNSAPQDASEPSASLPAGTISATIVDEHDAPLSGTQVRLGTLFQKISEGESRSETFAKTDESGNAEFAGLTVDSDHHYRVTVQHGPASYSSSPFNLRQDMGQRVLLHVFPSTTSIDAAMIGLRGYLYIATRDDVFQCEVLFRVFNVGLVTWVPENVVVPLPKGFKAFKAQDSMTDLRFEQVDGVGAKLKGTFSPGQNDVSFRFQVPKTNDDSVAFHMGLPPHVAEMRVIAEASPTMNLDVEGFDRPVPTTNNEGQRVLVAVKQLRRRDDEIKDFVATLSGIPTPGPGRQIALFIALALVITGVFAARGAFDDVDAGKSAASDKKKAREILLRELVALEQARRDKRIGPRAYQHSHERLVDAVARLGVPPERAAKKSPSSSRKRAKSAASKA
ncbi:MAG TPA: carboxypeptidase-like regulatory domain-containing protein [Polyangiaceae bacterium]|jgi:hypothetical protein|nr:carboxypeptidase-like regulatory domain-containing protein [Polyangiaceae bacterium]